MLLVVRVVWVVIGLLGNHIDFVLRRGRRLLLMSPYAPTDAVDG